jgi:heme oxygenase
MDTMDVSADVAPLASALLREATSADHESAERSAFQRQLVGGNLPRALYGRFLGEMLHVWRALDDAVAGLRALAGFAPLVDPSRLRGPDLERDLACLGIAASARTTATAAFCDQLRAWGAESPVSLAGALYVLEGSTNGGRFIARSVRRAYALDGQTGTAFLDPYGEAQPVRWAEWKGALDAAVPGSVAASLVPVARETFRAIEAIGAALLASAAVP